jgi:hypothetical protein
MAFTQFAAPAAKSPKVKTPKGLFATVMLNGPSSFVFHLPVSACSALGLVVGDRLRFYYDAKTGRMAFMKDPNGDHVLNPHGNNPKRLKTPFTKFMNTHEIVFLPGEIKVQAPLRKCRTEGMYSMPLVTLDA